MGNQMCCDGDNSREIQQVREAVPQPKAYSVVNQSHSQGVDGNEILRPLAHGDGRMAMGLKPSSISSLRSAPARALPESQPQPPGGGPAAQQPVLDRDRESMAVISPRPRSARPHSSVSSDGSSLAGVSSFTPRPPSLNGHLRVNSAFSHSPASPFARATGMSKSMVPALSLHGGRTQSSFAFVGADQMSFVGADQMSDSMNLQRMNIDETNTRGGHGRPASLLEPAEYYHEEGRIGTVGLATGVPQPIHQGIQ